MIRRRNRRDDVPVETLTISRRSSRDPHPQTRKEQGNSGNVSRSGERMAFFDISFLLYLLLFNNREPLLGAKLLAPSGLLFLFYIETE